MKIAIFSTHATWKTHLETELEIAQDLINKGNTVHFYKCDNKIFSNCENIMSRALLDNLKSSEVRDEICNLCNLRQQNGFKLLDGDFSEFSIINQVEKSKDYKFDEELLVDIDSFKTLIYDDVFDIGWSIVSSLVSYTRNPFIKLTNYIDDIRTLYCETIKVYETAKEALNKELYDRIYVFNGRFSYTRGLIRLANKLNVPVFIHERGSVPEKYFVTINKTSFDIPYFYECVNKHWDIGNFFFRYFKGRSFFKKKLNGFNGSWDSFTKNFDSNVLPIKFNKKRKNIIIFTSSEDEFVSIDETWNNPFFKNQLDGLIYLCEEYSKSEIDCFDIYIRIHPNSEKLNQEYLNKLYSLAEFKNVTVIEPNSKVSSYNLLFHCNRVITFGSTLTIESIFWGKPVILLGNSLYNSFKGPIIPNSKDEIYILCLKKKLNKPNNSDAIKIGYFLSNFGSEYKYYEPDDYINGKYRGVDLSVNENKK